MASSSSRLISRRRSRDSVMARYAASGGTTPCYSPRRRRPKRSRNVVISSSSSESEYESDNDDDSHSETFSDISRRRQTSSDQSPRYAPSLEEDLEEGDIGNSSQLEKSVVLSETDLLDCPICLDPLSPPVYQCMNGHLVCNSCFVKISKCPSCDRNLGLNRCIAIEKILESARALCRNWKYGCKVNTSYSKKLEHDKCCKFTACSCPYYDCNYVDMADRLYRHFSVQHSNSVQQLFINVTTLISLPKDINRVFLQERCGSMLFVLNRTIIHVGSLISVICVAPTSSGAKFAYRLAVRAGRHKLCLKSCVEVAPDCGAQPPRKNCLLVTSDFADGLEGLELQLLIQRLE